MENEKAAILWDSPVITDRHVPCNKPDIDIQEKKSDRCLIIDVAIPSDCNIQKKAAEMISKYVDLQIECQRICNKKVEIIPVIIGATGIVDNNIKKYIGRIPGCHNIYSLQRSGILGAAHILRKGGTVNKARLSNRTRHPTPCESKVWGLHSTKHGKKQKPENQRHKPPIIIIINNETTYTISYLFGQVSNSLCVIWMWHHHCHPASSSSSMSPVYSDSGYIIDRINFMCCMYINYFPHRCTLGNLDLQLLSVISGSYIIASTYFEVVWWINVAVYWFLMDLCSTVWSTWRLQ